VLDVAAVAHARPRRGETNDRLCTRSCDTAAMALGLGKGRIYPARHAAQLLNPLRHLIVSPSRIVRALGLEPTDRVLEIGCGPGWFSPTVARAVPSGRLIAFDIQIEMLRMAEQRVVAAGAACSCVQGSAIVLPFRDASIDVAFMVSVLGETGDCAATLREIRRVLVAGGRLTICEIRNDADFIPRATLRALAAAAGFAPEVSAGWRWNYIETYRAA